MYIFLLHMACLLLYPPQTLFVGGIWFHVVRPCVSASIRNVLFP